MKIQLHEITVNDLFQDYVNDAEDGVTAYGGLLNIRPKYQREFVYDEKKRNAVIDTVRKDFPLNVMYWVVNTDFTYEVLDGQQRTLSICEYLADKFAVGFRYFHNLTSDEKEQILNYKLMVYFCEGTESEKLAWFRTINIAGEKLTEQELRNASYTGEWLTDAKRYFSRTGCPAYDIASDYMSGSTIRQDYLETALFWAAGKDGLDSIESYMAKHQHDTSSNPLWLYFQKVIAWTKATFPTYRHEMKGLPWGDFYNRFHENEDLNPNELEKQVASLMEDDEVTKKRGIYEYVLDGERKHLSLRSFTSKQKREAYERQKGICPVCGEHFEYSEMEGDHIVPWSQGGTTTSENCQMLCRKDNNEKSNR